MNLILRILLFVCIASKALAHSPIEPAEQTRIEASIVPLVSFIGEDDERLTLEQRRAELGIPAVSTAVLRNGQQSWARAYGEGVDEHTLFQFASLSKTVAAAGIVALAFERGVDLDDDLSGDLTGLDLDRLNPEGLPITLRGLLSHTNGATVGGFRGYTPDEAVPSTAGVIEGQGNSDPVVIEPNPDRERRYSGGGYTIAQYWVEQVTGKSFEAVMRRLILDPLGMTRSTFVSLPPAAFDRENVAPATETNGEPIEGGWHLHPEQAAASLWSTPSEYLRFLAAVMGALDGEASTGIAPEVARALVTPVADGYGLGIGVAEIDGATRLTHSGSNIGYKSNFMAYPASGDAIVTVANAQNGWPMVGDIGRTANVEYGWPMRPLIERPRLDASAAELAAFTGDYKATGDDSLMVTLTAEAPVMLGSTPSGYRFRLIRTGEATFIDPQDGQEGTFVTDESGVVSVTFGGRTFKRVSSSD